MTRPRPPATGPSGLRGRVPAHRRTVCCLGQRWPRCPVRSLRPAQATACASVSPADRLRSPCPSASWPWAQIAARGARVRLQLSFRPCRLFSEFLGELLRPAHAGSLSLGRTPGRPALDCPVVWCRPTPPCPGASVHAWGGAVWGSPPAPHALTQHTDCPGGEVEGAGFLSSLLPPQEDLRCPPHPH